jgi:hypothetical protein
MTSQDRSHLDGCGAASEAPEDAQAGTREELRMLLSDAGLGPKQTRVWLDTPTAYLSGLIPAEAIADPATAARARLATRRLIARLGPKVPDLVSVSAARILEPGTRRILLEFDDGARRVMDLAPYLFGTGLDELRTSYEAFCRLHVHSGTVAWPGGISLSADLLYRESWPADVRPPSCHDGKV